MPGEESRRKGAHLHSPITTATITIIIITGSIIVVVNSVARTFPNGMGTLEESTQAG